MFFKSHIKRFVSFAIVLTVAFTAFTVGTGDAKAFDLNDIKSESRMDLGYSIINGYSKLSERKGLKSYDKSAVYSGLDITSPYNIALAGTFYFSHFVDLERLMTDNDYALSLIKQLDGYMSKFGVKNDRAAALKSELEEKKIQVLDSYDTVGMYIIKTDSETAEALMKDSKVDFVFAGGEVPPTMKDLNMDGKSDSRDAPLIQQFLAEELVLSDKDENEYIKFACDINGDKSLDINDVTELLTR